jgi:hypothetical protein
MIALLDGKETNTIVVPAVKEVLAGTTIVFVSLPSSKAIMFDDSGNIVDGAGTDTGLATKGFATAMGVAL